MNQLRNFAWVFWLVLAFGAHSAQAAKAQLISNPAEPREAFAAAEVEAALRSQSLSVRREDSRAAHNPHWRGARIMVIFGGPQSLPEPRARLLRVDPSTIAREGFQIRRFDRKDTTPYYEISSDPAGALYGGLEPAFCLLRQGQKAEIPDARSYVCERNTPAVAALLTGFFGAAHG